MALERVDRARSSLSELDQARHDLEKIELGGTHPATEEEYHLEFTTNRYRPATYAVRVDEFLAELFHPAPTPLVHDDHVLASTGGMTVVQVRFGLSPHGISTNTSMRSASEQLCTRIFKRSSRQYLSLVTTESILGVKAVSRVWRVWFSRAFFSYSLEAKGDFLRELNAALVDDRPPLWVLVLGFSLFFGLNFSIFATGEITKASLLELLNASTDQWSERIVRRYTNLLSTRPRAELEREYKTSHENFQRDMDRFISCLQRYKQSATQPTMTLTQHAHGTGANGSVAMTSKEAICDSLYTLGETLAQLATSNREVCESLIDEREKIKCHMAAGSASMGLSMFAGYSAFSTVEVAQTVAAASVAPELLASAGLAGYSGDVIITTTFLCFNPLVVATAAGMTAVLAYALYKKNEQRKKFNKLINYHKTMRDVVCQAWGLTHDTERCLMWVHCTDAQDPNGVEFLNEAARRNWRQFIQQLRSIAGRQATAEEMTASFVLTYLDTQRQSLCQIRDDVTNLYEGVANHYRRK